MNRGVSSIVLAVAWALCAGSSTACRERFIGPQADAGPDGGGTDGPAPLTLEIAVNGCTRYDPLLARCEGPAPLVLSFSPVGSPEFTTFRWTFGDGTPTVSNRAPVHTYALPGSYDVRVVGLGDIGSIDGNRVTRVVVAPVETGGPCDVDAQCGGDLRCVCTPGSGCPSGFVRGICSGACAAGDCAAGAICAKLALGPPQDSGAPAEPSACLAACQSGSDCSPGFVCETFPAGGASGAGGGWIRGCLPLGVLSDLGGPCRGANGALEDGRCSSGTCSDLGALGLCSAPCDDNRPCPDQATCARLPDGRDLCLVDCALHGICQTDPLLTCSAPTGGNNGNSGFRADASAGTTFCGPKPCTSDADCAPAGRCGPRAECIRRP